MTNPSVVIMDSGIGGLPYFSRVREMLPTVHVDYVADTAHFPYGDRSDDGVVGAVLSTVSRVISFLDPEIIVVACNTASVLALAELRRRYDLPFVGVVPAVKPACELSQRRSVGVLATERTIDGAYLDELIYEHCSDCTVVRIAAGPLVTFVERTFGESTAPSVADVAGPYVERLQAAQVDAVVLGCTHFVYLADGLAAAIGSGCQIVDSRDGVARQTARVVADLASHHRRLPQPVAGDRVSTASRFFVTGDAQGSRYSRLASTFGMAGIQRLPDV